ncbi:MAG: hypothetical protein ACE1ZW_02095 [Nitrospirales bacterium]
MGDGNVEKSRQRRSRPFAVLTYYEYAPRVKTAAALPVEERVLARLGWAGQTTDFFEHSHSLISVTVLKHLRRMDLKYSIAP